MYNSGSDAHITDCTFSNNFTTGDDGGGMYNGNSGPVITGCMFRGNSADHEGGATYSVGTGQISISNCTFSGNRGETGGAIQNWQAASEPELANCTFSGNEADNSGGGIASGAGMSEPDIVNCIFWGNEDRYGLEGGSSQILGSALVKYSCIQDEDDDESIPHGGGDPNYNIDGDPLFIVNPDDGSDGWGGENGENDDFGDLHLMAGSPCFNRGDPGGTYTGQTDIDGDLRVINGRVDVGSDEMQFAERTNLDHGESVSLYPSGTTENLTEKAAVWVENESGEDDKNVTVSQADADLHEGNYRVAFLGTTLSISTTMDPEDFSMVIVIPFNEDDLGDLDWSDVRVQYYAGGWEDVEGYEHPPKRGPGQQPWTLDELSGSDYRVGDYGVYWHIEDKEGYAWAKVDHVTDFAAVVDLPVAGIACGLGADTYGQSSAASGDDYIAVAAGEEYGAALKSDGTIAGWGRDNYDQNSPPDGSGFTAIDAGGDHGVALKSDGSVVTWGSDVYHQVVTTPNSSDFTAISAGYRHNLALKYDGSIVGWGDGTYGQILCPNDSNFVAIAAGGYHSLAINTDGNIVGWGGDDYNQVSTIPDGNNFTAISAGLNYSLALTSDGNIVGWGWDDSNQVSDIPDGNGFAAICAGYYHGLALTNDGNVVGWGRDDSNQVSDIPDGNNFVGIAGGGSHSMVLYECSLSADLTGDCYVNIDDLDVFAGQWLLTDERRDCSLCADLTGYYCSVTFEDFAIIAEQWLQCGNPMDPSCER